MAIRYQLAADCANPDLMARFWAEALHYELQGPPDGFESWVEYWRNVGLPEEEHFDGYDSIVDPAGAGPRVWFQHVPEPKQVKNRAHFDILVGGGRSVPMEVRKARVDAEVARLERLGARLLRTSATAEIDHYFAAMVDPEGNEFDVV